MNLRPLGSTGRLVSPIGLGLAALGRPGYINLGHAHDLEQDYAVPHMEARAHRVLDAAWAAGIRYFDAARSYGRAEAFLGHWLHARAHDPYAVTVGSKWGYTYTADWQVDAETHEVKEHSLPVLRRQWQESQEHLGEHLDLYQVHSATLSSGILDNREVLEHLLALKRQYGVAIGLSLSGSGQTETLRQALGLAFDGERLFDTVQATWNLLEPSISVILEEAHSAGMGVIVKEALANGRLTERNADPAFAPSLDRLRHQAGRLATSVDALALAAVLAQPWAGVVLSGAATPQHLRSNVQAVEVAWDEEAASALAVLTEPPDVYWRKRDALAWN